MDIIDIVPLCANTSDLEYILACIEKICHIRLQAIDEIDDHATYGLLVVGKIQSALSLPVFAEKFPALVIDNNNPQPFSRTLHLNSSTKQKWRDQIGEFLSLEKQRKVTPLLHEFAQYNLHGRSQLFIQVLETIKQVAQYEAPVLIEGETGTGKENTARAVHYLSERQDNAFIPVNCAAIPETLIESELFGHAKGAFTGADQTQKGLVELAEGGTLFLDEVDSLSAKAQAVMLRFLQTGEYYPVGGAKLKRANVHVLAATNASLTKLIKEQTFREDLYYRLNVLNIRVPPLRERPQDIDAIIDSLLPRFQQQHKRSNVTITVNYRRWLKRQSWPGNVRELENTFLRDFLLCREGRVDKNEGDYEDNNEIPILSFKDAKEAAIAEFEEDYVKKMLAYAKGNVSEAARYSGKERRAFGKLIKKYQIEKTSYS